MNFTFNIFGYLKTNFGLGLSFLFLFAISQVSLANTDDELIIIEGKNFQLSIGPEPNWKEPLEISNEGGRFFSQIKQMKIDGVYWVRWEMNIISGANPKRAVEYYLSILGAYEAYWDGKLVGVSGKVGHTIDAEIPGPIESVFLVPKDWVTPGKHISLFKLSSHHRPVGYDLFRHAFITDYGSKSRFISMGSLIPTLLVSMTLIIGFYFIVLFISDKKNTAYLIFSLICLDLFVFGLSIQWPHLVGYTYDWAVFNNRVGLMTASLFPMLLPLFFLFKNNLKRFWMLILIVPIAYFISINAFDIPESGKGGLAWLLGLSLSILIVGYVTWRKQGKYWWELVGLAFCLYGIIINESDLEDFFYFFPILISLILVSNAIEAQRLRLASFRFSLKSSQLEAQLLRKNIQPHFILNSLASLIEWVETSPEQSVEFISALADEFRIFAEISGKEVIAVNKEIELCRHHLAIMTFRLQQEFTINVNGFEREDVIPPGIIHTLIENAFSHNNYSNMAAYFQLTKEITKSETVISFKAPVNIIKNSKYSYLNTGTGLVFIESQLNQYFGNGWTIKHSEQDGFWVTTIKVPSLNGRNTEE